MNDTYKQQQIERTVTLANFAKGVAQVLGLTYKAPNPESADWQTRLQTPSHGDVFLNYSHHNRKIHVSGCWPSNAAGEVFSPARWLNLNTPGITVSVDRDVTAAAKDIARRFLPAYYEVWTVLKQRADASDDFHEKKMGAALLLAKAAGGTVTQSGRGNSAFVRGEHCEIEVRSADSFIIKHHDINQDQAVRLIEFLKDL
jgi:hypothetical protein